MREDIHNKLKIVSGILLLIGSTFLLTLFFIEPDSIAALFNFSLDLSAENLGEAIAMAITGMLAQLFFGLAVMIFGGIYFIFFLIIGSLNIALRKSKGLTLFVIIIIGISLILEIRAFTLIIIANYQSIVLPIHIAMDIVIMIICVYSTVFLFHGSKSNKEVLDPQNILGRDTNKL